MCIDKVHCEMFQERSSSKGHLEYLLAYSYKQREKQLESTRMKRQALCDESAALIDWNRRMCGVHEELTCGAFVSDPTKLIKEWVKKE